MYKLIYAIGWTISLLPFWLLYGAADILAFFVWHLSLYRKNVVITNIRNSFPEKPPEEIRRIARRFFRHFGDQVMESFKLFHMGEKGMLKRFSYVNPEILQDYYKDGRSVLLTSAHYANWEWLVSLPLITKHKILIVYKPPSQTSSDWIYKRFQGRFGGISVEMNRLPRVLIEYRQKEEQTATFILNDQRPVKQHIRYWTTFLSQDTPWLNGLDRLAKKNDQAVVFVHVDRLRRGKYEVTFHPLADKPKESGDNEITRLYANKLEEIIRKRPEFWLWTHRRWKTKKSPEIAPGALSK